jgi:hypothetical protein
MNAMSAFGDIEDPWDVHLNLLMGR